MEKEIKFADGLFYFAPPAAAPESVVCNLSFGKESFIKWLSEQDDVDGFVKVSIMKSKTTGKPFAMLNTFKPTQKQTEAQSEVSTDDLPF
jgi:hypothetical protein